MVTLVGTQDNVIEALQSLIELDYDAMEAYQAAINRLENEQYKSKLEEFCADHKRHVEELSLSLRKHDITPESQPSSKQWLTKGKVVLANMVGDEMILRAMLSNEIDTNSAYQEMSNRHDIWDDLMPTIKRGLADERKHKKWLESIMQG